MGSIKSFTKLKTLIGPIGIVAFGLAFFTPANAETILYSNGHPIDTGRLSTFGGHSLGSAFASTDSNWATALGGGFGAFDAIVVGEGNNIGSLSSASRTAIAGYASGGGNVIVLGHANPTFLNSIFGYSIVQSGSGSASTVAGTLDAAASTATTYAGGPGSLLGISATNIYTKSSLPGALTCMYGTAISCIVASGAFGSGSVTAFGYDLFSPGASGGDDWYRVLDSAIRFDAGVSVVPLPAALPVFLTGLAGLGFMRRRKLQQK